MMQFLIKSRKSYEFYPINERGSANSVFPEIEEINAVRSGDTAVLAALDSAGLLPAVGETPEVFADRLLHLQNAYADLTAAFVSGKIPETLNEVPINLAEQIPVEIMEEAAEQTRSLFGFSINWVPGFFLSKGLGLFWGGCTISDEQGVSVFIVRKSFSKSKRWFIYDRRELLAHELCHVARFPLEDNAYEEHFAYMTSQSRFRKYIGNCFQTEYDAFFFLIPILLLLAFQIGISFFAWPIPILPFWGIAALWPGFLLVRNARSRKTYFQAKKALEQAGVNRTEAVLFRCTASELHSLAKLVHLPDQVHRFARTNAERDLRWKIILTRFFQSSHIQVSTS